MSAQKDCEFLVKRARELVSDDPCAAKAWLITARTLYPTDFKIQVTTTKYHTWLTLTDKFTGIVKHFNGLQIEFGAF